MSDDSVFPQPLLQWVEKHGEKEFHWVNAGGLTKRELFAAMAMQGIIGSADSRDLTEETDEWPKYVAVSALAYADGLLAELEKKGEG